jgi:farnesyl-diphosphate farnesyltransferase
VADPRVAQRVSPPQGTEPSQQAAQPGIEAGRAYCSDMLPKVSRTFALCIRLLPPDLEHPVLLAYLLCRIADTIEDAPALPGAEKSKLLSHFRSCLDDGGPDAGPIAERFADPRTDEEELTNRADTVLREFRRLPSFHQSAIRPWVQEMCSGMAGFASKYDDGDPETPRVLTTVNDLERYCYFVAGTVGHLLTDLFASVRLAISPRHYAQLKPLATSFGLGLQLTNIIKDVADDRRRGWTFVPQELCDEAGIEPSELHDPDRNRQARRAMLVLIRKAQGHLHDALEYCTRLPRSEYRVRLFCLTSLYFAVRTLRVAAHDTRLLDPEHKVKITRGDVYRTVLTTTLIAPSNTLVRAYFKLLADR